MNKEQEELLDEVYDHYCNSNPDAEKTFQYEGHNIETRRMTKDEFVDMVKTDKECGRRWGLKIEERELSLEERETLLLEIDDTFRTSTTQEIKLVLDEYNIPTKLITITYKDKTIESYE
jgi:hypothetical protein